MHRHAESIEIEMRVTRLHRVPRPLYEFSSLAHRLRPLRPLQTRSDALILVVARDGHHVRIAEDLVLWPDGGKMMNEAYHPIACEGAERPTSSLSRNYEMSAGRNLQVRKPKRLALEIDTSVKFFYVAAFTDYDLCHPLPLKVFG